MRSSAAILCVLILCLFVVSAQETIRVDTRLVVLNLYVEDKNGNPVEDLKREDLALFDGKKQEDIRVFSRQTDGVTHEAAPLPPGTYTNRIEATGAVPRAVTAVVIDQLNTPWQKQHYNRNLMLKMLERIDPEHRVSLYVLGTQLRILHDFTSDTGSLIETLRAISTSHNTAGNRPDQAAESGPEMPVTGVADSGAVSPGAGGEQGKPGAAAARLARMREVEKILAETEATNAILDGQRRAWTTLGAIEAVAQRLARIPGRKNLVWVSSGFPVTFFEYLNSPQGRARPAHILRDFERTSRALVNSGVSFYSVNAGDSGGIALDVTQQNAVSTSAVRQWERNAWGSMLEISGLTGGRAFGNIQQFGEAMARAAADARNSYTIGYYPSHNDWDGSFREIRIKALRPGLKLRHKAGYVALAERPQAPQERRASLDEAAWSPLDATAIPMDVRLLPASKPNHVRIMVLIDPAALAIIAKDRLRVCELDFLYIQQKRHGAGAGAIADTISLKLTPERYQQLMSKRMGVNKEFEIAPGAERLRVVVRDVTSSAVGSVTADIRLH